MIRALVPALIFLVSMPLGFAQSNPALPPVARAFDFDGDIRPILEKNCVECHGAERQKGKFRLDSRDYLLQGGENGEAVRVGKSADSPLIHLVARLDEDAAMPPKKERALTPEAVGKLRAWIDAGAPFPEGFVIRNTAADSFRLEAKDLAKLPPPAPHPVDFVRDIQPIFAAHCANCHGPKRQEAGFRLDHKPTVLAGGELGKALVPGRSAESLLIHFVAGLRPEGRMPQKGEPLSAEQIGLLRAWIDQGADFPDSASIVLVDKQDHWAFKPPVRPSLPTAPAAEAHPIDAFIAARLAKDDLTFSPEADRTTLLRRMHLDLTGLPPTLAELDAFLADTAPDAYERAVDRLLASPHYGERWARHWLDAARYADSDGYEKDKPRIAHFYRDWVVDAFNRDLPYDRFIVEQLAGDQLPKATQDQRVATGFLRNSMLNEEGGVDPEQFRMEAMFDRMDAIGRSMLGLTLACAQCHTHKYDPITQEEYYRIFAFLNNDHEAQPRVYAADELRQRADILRQIGEIEARLQHATPDWEERLARWEDAWRAHPRTEWQPITPEVDKNATGGQRYLTLKDGSFMTAGFQPTKSTGVLRLKQSLKEITGFRLEMLHDPNLPAQGPGRSHLGTFALSEFQVEAANAEGKNAAVKFARASADLSAAPETPVDPAFNEKEPKKRVIGPASYAIDGNNDTGWSSDLGPGRRNLESVAVFATEKPLSTESLTIKLVQNIGGWNADDLHSCQMGRFRVSVTTSPNPQADPVPPLVRAALKVPRAQRSPAQTATLFSYWRTVVAGLEKPDAADWARELSLAEWKAAHAEIEKLWAAHPEGATQFTLVSREETRPTFVLKRGDWLKPGKGVEPGVPAFLNPLPAAPDYTPRSRLALAHWLTDRQAPTTARAFVNRVWQTYFGTGLVATSEDLGVQAEAPSHPELLDWLAVEFMEPRIGRPAEPWSIKHLHRLILTSRTYRQSSRVTPDLLAKDPYNRLLARGPRFRVEGEIVRDIQLAVSGLLNPRIGGRAVMPPAPEFLFQPPASYAPFPWKEEVGEDRYRRALYTWRRRTTPYPMLAVFDVPEGNTSCVRRTRANTPLQALMTLNETVSVEAARALALRILTAGGSTDAERLTFAFRTVLSRPPTEPERIELTRLLAKQSARIADGWVNPWETATGNPTTKPTLPPDTTPAQLAGYTVVARVLLNLDETITKE